MVDFDTEKVDEMVLALLALNQFEAESGTVGTWKSHNWDALDRLHKKGHISDPRNRNKSVFFTEEGLALANALLARHFGPT